MFYTLNIVQIEHTECSCCGQYDFIHTAIATHHISAKLWMGEAKNIIASTAFECIETIAAAYVQFIRIGLYIGAVDSITARPSKNRYRTAGNFRELIFTDGYFVCTICQNEFLYSPNQR